MKQQDYGSDTDPFANVRASEEFGVLPWVGALIRANDKVKRLKNAANGRLLVNEPIEDSFRDAAVYFVIAWTLWEEQRLVQAANPCPEPCPEPYSGYSHSLHAKAWDTTERTTEEWAEIHKNPPPFMVGAD
jgi:hypothetical protein